MTAPADYDRVLVIKLGALGDFIQALRAMAEIRRAHPKARLTLLTTPPYADLARASGYFDAIDTGGRPRGLAAHVALFRRMRRMRPQRIYDLQTSSRSRNYLYAFAPAWPEWSGISPGASHRHRNPRRDRMQNQDRLWDQIAAAGIVDPLPEGAAPGPDLAWAVAAAHPFNIPEPYALLAPGASPGHPLKRWPADHFAALARNLEALGLTPVVIGGPEEAAAGAAIALAAPRTRNLAGKTRLVDLAGLGSRAALMVGNDTGPLHLAALAGAPSVGLFSRQSDPAHAAPRAARVHILQSDVLADLSVDQVTKAVKVMLGCA